MIRVAISGGAGRMGQAISMGLSDLGDMTIVALIDVREPTTQVGAIWRSTLAQVDATDVDVLVDFSAPEFSKDAVRWALENDVGLVIGTTGLSNDDLDLIASDVDAQKGHVVVAPNFAIGAVLADRFARQAAPYFERVEIIELHHDQKRDAPSGTSLATAAAIAASRRAAGREPISALSETELLTGARGARTSDGVQIHSVRLPGLTAHQEVLFGGPGEGLIIRHDSFDRQSFVSGVALAVRAVRSRPGLTRGLDELLS